MARKILIIGAGGHGKVVADAALAAGDHVVGFVDADAARVGQTVLNLPILGTMARLEHVARAAGCRHAAVAIGDNRVRHEHAREVRRAGLNLATIVHPAATVSPSATLAAGVVVCMGAALCVEATIGEAALINTNATVDHECIIGPAAHVGPGARLAGRVEVGEGAFVGIGATIIQCVRLGRVVDAGRRRSAPARCPGTDQARRRPGAGALKSRNGKLR